MTDTDEKNPRGAIRGHIVVLSQNSSAKISANRWKLGKILTSYPRFEMDTFLV
jgi:hypothetical protein